MTTIFERVSTALGTLSPAIPYALAPYKSSDALPATFIAYQLIDDSAEQHADDAETERSSLIQITVWDTTGLVTLPNVDAAMVASGFQKGHKRQLPQDQETGHYGLAMEYIYV